MSRRKSTVSSATQIKNDFASGFLTQFKWGESYISLILGIVVVVIAAVLVVSFARSVKPKGVNPISQQTLSQKTERAGKGPKEAVNNTKTYTVSTGENLWSISEKVYKSGYNWTYIAKVNNLTDPGSIHSGNVLKLPGVKTEVVPLPNQSASITGDTYIIQKGDFLWNIAVRAYGDGFRWVDIARANNLTDPNLIFSENILKIPR